MAVPNLTVALPRVDANYLAADDYMMDREVLNEVVDGYNEQSFLRFLEITNRAKESKNTVFSHYEKGLMYRSVGIGAVIGTPTASSAVITLTADSYTTVGSLTGNIDRAPLKATDVVMLPGGIHAYVTVKTSPTPAGGSGFIAQFTDGVSPSGTTTRFTIVRRDGDTTSNIGTAVAAMVTSGERMIAYTNAHAEGSYLPVEGMDALNTRYIGQMQIWKTVASITGDADSNSPIIPWLNGSFKYTSKQRAEALIKHKADMGWANLLSPGGSFTNAAGEKVLLTKGMEGYLKDLGNNYPFTSTFDLADLNAIVALIKANWGGREYMWVMGAELRASVETLLRTFTANGNLSYNSFGIGSDKQRAIDLGFDSFHFGGITFHLIEEQLFNHPQVTGLAGMDYANTGFLIPTEDQKVTYMDEYMQRNFEKIPSVWLRYKVDSIGSRRFRDATYDFRNNGGRDVMSYGIQSQEGLQMANLHKFIRVYKAD